VHGDTWRVLDKCSTRTPSGAARGVEAGPDFHIAAERGEKVHQAFDRKSVQPVTNEVGNVRLQDAERLGAPGLREAALAQEPVYFHRQLDLEAEFLRIREAKVRKTLPLPASMVIRFFAMTFLVIVAAPP